MFSVFFVLRFVACAFALSFVFPRFVTTLNTKVKKKETAANFFNHLRKNKEQHTHFIHSYKSRQSE